MKEKSQVKLIRDKRLHVVFGITLMAVLGVSSLTPAFPLIAKQFSLSKVEVAMLISVFTLPGIVLTPLTGVMADRLGRKKVLIPALILFASAGSACFFSTSFSLLLILRFFQGIGAAALGSLNITLIGDIYKGPQRGAAMGYNASVLSVGTAFYPLIGGFLASFAWNFPFILPLLAVPVVIGMLRFPSDYIPAKQNFSNYMSEAWQSLKKKEIIAVLLISIATFIILYGAFLSYFPFLLHDNFALDSSQIGVFMSLSSIFTMITASLLGRLLKKHKASTLLKIAFLLYLIVNLIVPSLTSLYWFIIPIAMFGVAQGLNIPSLQTLLANLAPEKQRAAFMSANGMVLRIGQTIGPAFIGLGFAFGGLAGAFYLAAIVAVLVLLLIFSLLKKV